ncbi:MAG TPA: MFS transporter [Rhodoglobus sp.]|nr:MFS transporter [Rhodoglobus sp.]
MNRSAAAYLASYALSMLGNSIAAIALPLILLQATGSALAAGTLALATAVPAVLAGLVGGVVIDRINRVTSSVVADLISAAAVAALPIVDAVTGLSLGWFILFGVIGAVGDVPGMTAREALLPAIVRRGGLQTERLVGLRESIGAISVLVGPAAAGGLMVLFDGSTVLWITAATSLGAALLTLLIPRHDGAVEAAPIESGGWAQLKEGWRTIATNRFVLVVTALNLGMILVLVALQSLVLPVWFTAEEQPGLLGFVLSALALGTLVGSGVFAALGARGARRAWFVGGMVGTLVGIALITTLTEVWVVLTGAVLLGATSGILGSMLGVLMIERVPERLMGRVMGTQNALITAAAPLGIAAAAVLTESFDVQVAALAFGGAWLGVVVASLISRSLRTVGTVQGDAG